MLLAVGYTAGAITGILFAPDKGEKTRKRIRSKAGEISEDIEKAYDEEMDRLKSKIDKLKSRFTHEVNEAIKEVDTADVNAN